MCRILRISAVLTTKKLDLNSVIEIATNVKLSLAVKMAKTKLGPEKCHPFHCLFLLHHVSAGEALPTLTARPCPRAIYKRDVWNEFC